MNPRLSPCSSFWWKSISQILAGRFFILIGNVPLRLAQLLEQERISTPEGTRLSSSSSQLSFLAFFTNTEEQAQGSIWILGAISLSKDSCKLNQNFLRLGRYTLLSFGLLQLSFVFGRYITYFRIIYYFWTYLEVWGSNQLAQLE